ncbi:homogentisate 1,2-dioxygenase [Capronia epimyces CBS 606.96]|uniref:homogentisate 1,2-dioxygenase n=1 Tax=Capronia epimyces CBS 606.96 TaxID=1182542 RepID=W9Y675_9EURO|nr:homogentisate 1,2-dioxygenase [Capronia epimyces CBS 606.96]EXJ84726.1 homogentisate 1,2-dioxygenase [Capronia epimyces CBS 606.96]
MISAPSPSPSPPFGATARCAYSTTPSAEDPYAYQVGFGNRFATEAIPGVLPQARNTPQRCKYDLFSEQLNGTPFVSARASQLHAWFYRIRPSVAHRPLKKLCHRHDIQACFSASSHTSTSQFLPQDQSWDAFPLPDDGESVDFVQGIKTIGGHGDPVLKEGLAVHVYTANQSMDRTAFCNNDGDLLILPQQGRLDIQTEFGHMMVRPGELAVIQAGIRFKVRLPDGPVRGYMQEIFGSHYELPELGPIGSNGMALPRDFEHPLASFDVDVDKTAPWTVQCKLAGQLFEYEQEHTPFDVVAWHGNYVPYKYALDKFVNAATVDKEQSDPSIYCVLMARSKTVGVALSEFLVFTPKWSVTTNTFRPPYYHRNVATELMGMISGVWSGSVTTLVPGGLTYEPSFMPHGESYERWREATTADLQPQRVNEDAMAFMFHISGHISLTDYALQRTGVLHDLHPTFWDGFEGGFVKHLDQVNKDLAAAGLPPLAEDSARTRTWSRTKAIQAMAVPVNGHGAGHVQPHTHTAT